MKMNSLIEIIIIINIMVIIVIIIKIITIFIQNFHWNIFVYAWLYKQDDRNDHILGMFVSSFVILQPGGTQHVYRQSVACQC